MVRRWHVCVCMGGIKRWRQAAKAAGLEINLARQRRDELERVSECAHGQVSDRGTSRWICLIKSAQRKMISIWKVPAAPKDELCHSQNLWKDLKGNWIRMSCWSLICVQSTAGFLALWQTAVTSSRLLWWKGFWVPAFTPTSIYKTVCQLTSFFKGDGMWLGYYVLLLKGPLLWLQHYLLWIIMRYFVLVVYGSVFPLLPPHLD